jgi:hypothetical protein
MTTMRIYHGVPRIRHRHRSTTVEVGNPMLILSVYRELRLLGMEPSRARLHIHNLLTTSRGMVH